MGLILEQRLYNRLKSSREKNDTLKQQLYQSQHREREAIKERDVWCDKCLEAEDRERVLREALEEIKTISSVAEQLTTFYEAESLRSLIESIAIEALEASK